MKHLKATYRRLIKNTDYRHHRYIFKELNLNERLTGLIGARGTGKTTLLLQYIKEKKKDLNKVFYVSVDNIYFTQHRLIDFINELYEIEGVKEFYLDEIHKYPNWNQELKNIYDSYPDVKVFFSGSSCLDLIKGSYDLSRRGVLYQLNGLSFREYLIFKNIKELPPFTFDDILNNKNDLEKEIENIDKIKGHFKNYLLKGYYPFLMENEKNYYTKILNVLNKTIFEDISNYYKLKTENLANFNKIISFLTTIPPGELNRNNISKHLGQDNKTVQNYLNILNDTGIVNIIHENKSGSHLLKSKEKIYLNNPDIYHAVSEEIGIKNKLGTIREIFFINMIKNSGNKIFYSKTGDFEVNGSHFEIGGKTKSIKQIKDKLENSYLVKDDIIHYEKHAIPLMYFGFLY